MRRMPSLILWIPRILAVALAFFLAMFAMDVYLEGKDFLQTSEAFIVHLIPAFCVIALLVIGWRRDGLASIGFLLLALAFFVALSGWKNVGNSLMLTLPPLGISLAFYARLRLLKAMKRESDE